MADGDYWETIWTLWKIALSGLVFMTVLLIAWILFPEYGGLVVVAALSGVTVFLYAKATQSRSSSEEILVNYVTSHGIPVGGKLEPQSESLLYTPNDMEKMLRREPFEILYEEIESIEHIPRLGDGFVAIFTRAGFTHRIQIELKDGSEELFVSSNLDSDIEKLYSVIDAEKLDGS